MRLLLVTVCLGVVCAENRASVEDSAEDAPQDEPPVDVTESEVKWCTSDMTCQLFGDEAATCNMENNRCSCGSADHGPTTAGDVTAYLCSESGTTLTLKVVLSFVFSVDCSTVDITEHIESLTSLFSLTTQRTAGGIASHCGSLVVVSEVDGVDALSLAATDVKEVANKHLNSASFASLKAAVGEVTQATTQMGGTACTLDNAASTYLLPSGVCAALSCNKGYSVENNTCVFDPTKAPDTDAPDTTAPDTNAPATSAPATSAPSAVFCSAGAVNPVCSRNDAGGSCVAGQCTCSAGYAVPVVGGEAKHVLGCWATGVDLATTSMTLLLKLRFADGDYPRLLTPEKAFLEGFVKGLVKSMGTVVYRQGSIEAGVTVVVSLGDVGKVEEASMRVEWEKALAANTAMRTTFGATQMTAVLSAEGDSSCSAVSGVEGQLKLGSTCVPFTCLAAYDLKPVDPPVCEPKGDSSSSSSAGLIVAIVLGTLVFVMLVAVAFYYLVCKKESRPAVREEQDASGV